MKGSSRVLVLLLAGTVLACGGKASTGARVRSDPNLITRDKIAATSVQTAYQVVQQLRPNWFNTTPQSLSNPTAGGVVVYLDGTRVGGVEFLRNVQARDVETLQYMSPADASTRFGLNHTGGAILVVTRR